MAGVQIAKEFRNPDGSKFDRNAEKARKRAELSDAKQTELTLTLNSFYERWKKNEPTRCAQDMRGAKFAASKMWSGAGKVKLPITSNTGKALLERRIAMTTRNLPIPEVKSLDGDDEAERVLSGSLRTIWRERRMQELLKRGERLTAVTRPIGWYVSWDSDLNGGIGDVHTRIIPAHRLIVDDRQFAVDDMKYAGFVEPLTRSDLVKLYPDKANVIENAGVSGSSESGIISGKNVDPLDVWNDSLRGGNTGGNQLQTQGPGSPFKPVRDTAAKGMAGMARQSDPLAEKIETKFLWYRDDNVTKREVPKMVKGRPVIKHERDESGNIKLRKTGNETIDTPWGPVNQPIYEATTHMETELEIVKVYPYWRHSCWISDGGTDVLLWDVSWDGPNPIVIQRDMYSIDGFYHTGSAHEIFSLAAERNRFWTLIDEKLRLSLDNTYLAGHMSGLKNNRLTAEPGAVYQVKDVNQIKEFPHAPLDAGYFSLLDKNEQEMERLIGLPPVSLGEGSGERTAISTYEQLTESGGVTVLDHAQMIETTISDWCRVAMWFVQHKYTTEHIISVEREDGSEDYQTSFNLLTRGQFRVRVEAGSTFNHSPSAKWNQIKEGMATGVYTIIDAAKCLPGGMSALKRRAVLQKNPGLAWLQGASAASPAQQAGVIKAQGRRSHHKPGGR